MAVARFQILAVLQGDRPSSTAGFTWRFLSANNRRLGQSAVTFPDAESCVAAIRRLRDRLDALTSITMRDGLRQWVWRIRLGSEDLAVSTRSYQRRVEADHACASFVDQMGKVAMTSLNGPAGGFIRRSSPLPPRVVRPCDLRVAPNPECA